MASTATIDYWSLVSRSLRIIWKHKFLLFFGFFATAGGGGGRNWAEDVGPRLHDFFFANPVILVLIIVGLVIVWLVLFVMSLISKGALVAALVAGLLATTDSNVCPHGRPTMVDLPDRVLDRLFKRQ